MKNRHGSPSGFDRCRASTDDQDAATDARAVSGVDASQEAQGILDNTLIFVTADNGASGEGGLEGTFNETYVLNGLQTPFEANMSHYEDWGGPTTYPHFPAGWALAGNTPFQYI